ncbi:MAG: DMT family transporter [Anaerolineae bacterium]|nr:DMT family transporter [Anaerolineae bacterium]
MNRRITEWAGLSPVLMLVSGVLATSTGSLFIRLAQSEMSSLAVATWRMTLASLILTPIAFKTCGAEWKVLQRRDWAFVLVSGIFLAVHFYTWITSLAFTSVAASVVLVSTSPLFVAVIAHFFLNERLTGKSMAGLAVALLGSVIIAFGDIEVGTHNIWGDFLALLGAMAVAVYMLIGRKLRSHLSLLAYVFPVYATAALVLMVTALLSSTVLIGFSPNGWLALFALAIIPQIVGHSSLNWALGHLPATYVSLVVLAEPLGAMLLVWLFLGESPVLTTLAGGVLVLAGIVLASRRSVEK